MYFYRVTPNYIVSSTMLGYYIEGTELQMRTFCSKSGETQSDESGHWSQRHKHSGKWCEQYGATSEEDR